VTPAARTLPLLLTSLQAAQVCGVSRSTFNAWVAQGRIPDDVIDKPQFGGWQRYRRNKLQQWADGELHEAAS
jgi:predicted DNA-binding transcriptional regulator AlpA